MNQQADSRQASVEIEVTPAMIEAGVAEFHENFRLSANWCDLVSGIYLAMALSSPRQLQLENEAT